MTIDLPQPLEKLNDLAYNLWFSWNPEVRDLFKDIDIDLWREVNKNPVDFLYTVDPRKLQELSEDPTFIGKIQKTWDRFNAYMKRTDTRFARNFPKMMDHQISYFSAEYGIHESLPNYAGGLGIIARDHTKTASDLGLPFVAVGLMYKHAYFTQEIDKDGNQTEEYSELDRERLPIKLVMEDNEPLLIEMPLLDHEVMIRIWEVQVGRIKVFLLDTDVDKNIQEDREIIHSLYGGSRDTRIRQEIILGIGGLRALRRMNYSPSIYHMNEGHSAFLGLERLYELMNEGMDFKTALEYVRATSLFTTHTPIPAGNEAFEFDMIEKYFKNLWPKLEISHEKFLDLGRSTNIHQYENFSLTVLALNLSSQANGVSKLHGEVSRSMWQSVWPGIPRNEVPIGHVTNGVHTFTWLHREMISLFNRYMGPDWRDHVLDQHYWDKIYDIPNEILWDSIQSMKNEMITHLRKTYEMQLQRYGEDNAGYPAPERILDPNILTIGFARRFAPYKRALLFFRDLERARQILTRDGQEVQILFAGKAHPANDAGKDLIRRLNQYAKDAAFQGKIVFVEGYNMNNARALVTGVDIWMNTPRRPLEASGTSGQKVPINLGINLSILDGWWLEGYNGQNGWAIGSSMNYDDQELQDTEDSNSLYSLLENEIVPLYYKRDEKGIPQEWIDKLKVSFYSTITDFSAHRMVWNYVNKYYLPAMRRAEKFSQEEYRELHQFAKWKNRISRMWENIHLRIKNGKSMDEDTRVIAAGESREIALLIDSGGLSKKDLRVEVTLERQDAYRGYQEVKVIQMGLVHENGDGKLEYRAYVEADKDGSYRYNCRVLPSHPDLYNPHETRLIKWLD
jgi:starch phosphorylase